MVTGTHKNHQKNRNHIVYDDHEAKKTIDFTDDIIIIDDDVDDRGIIYDMFQKINNKQRLRFFKNGEEFLNHLQCQNIFWTEDKNLGLPRLIIVDMHMPFKNGIQTIHGIKSNAIWNDVPVILVTSTDDDDKITEAYELGANTFLPKPFSQMDLIKAVYQGLNDTHNFI